MTSAAAQAAARAFNAKHPVGTVVWYWPGLRTARGRRGVTSGAAQVYAPAGAKFAPNCYLAAVAIALEPAPILLSHVDPVGELDNIPF